MSSGTLYKVSAIFLALGGILGGASGLGFAILDPNREQYTANLWFPLHLMTMLGGMLIGAGLPGFYAYQARASGKLGLVSVIWSFFGTLIILVMTQISFALLMPYLGDEAPPPVFIILSVVGALVLYMPGLFLLGLATWRAGVYSRTAALALMIVVVAGLFGGFLPLTPPLDFGTMRTILVPLVLAWLGYDLWQRAESPHSIRTSLGVQGGATS